MGPFTANGAAWIDIADARIENESVTPPLPVIVRLVNVATPPTALTDAPAAMTAPLVDENTVAVTARVEVPMRIFALS